VEQAEFWNGDAGRSWVGMQAVTDEMLEPVGRPLLELVDAETASVLDIGCGTGATTAALARRLGERRSCLGVDISEPMVAAARERAEREGLSAEFAVADAETHDFAADAFDAIVSRFGVMFFADPVAAFANLGRAARPGARLRFVAWRDPAENPFMTISGRAAADLLPDLPAWVPDGPGPFGLADPERTRGILDQAGWEGIELTAIDPTCGFAERDLVAYFTNVGPIAGALRAADQPTRDQVVPVVRSAFEQFVEGDSVRFTAACWLVDARWPVD
jgi:SAM-dependent methyltransferase